MTWPALLPIRFSSRLRAAVAQVVDYTRQPLLLAACFSLVAGSPAFAQLPAREWGFFEYTKEFATGLSNARLGRVTGLVWTTFEPTPGSGQYDWRRHDSAIKKAQANGMNPIFEIKTGNGSAFSDPGCFQRVEAATPTGAFPMGRALASCPLKPEMESAWSRMVTELVERYDGDGTRDMPGLLGNIRLDIEVENESANPEFWDYGTDRTLAADHYLRLLEISYQAKQVANPQTRVILTGLYQPNVIALCDAICDANPTHQACTPFNLGNVAFTKPILARPDIFDAVDIHFFAYYHFEPSFVDDGYQWVADQMLQGGYQRPIYSLEWTGSNMMPIRFEGYADEFRAYFPYSADFPTNAAFQAMYVGLDQPQNVTYRKWFESEEAKEYGKLFANMLALGVSRLVHVQYADYRAGAVWNNVWWNWHGVIKYVDGVAIRKPSYYTSNTLSQRIFGFTSARRIAIAGSEVRLYEFTFPTGEPTYVAWTDGADTVLDLSSVTTRTVLRVTHLVTELDGANAPIVTPDEFVFVTTVPVGDVPVLLKGI